MRTLLKNHTIRKGLLLYRKVRYRKGHGVHSPFVFKLITRVIEEKSGYYSYDDIALIRQKMYYSKESVRVPDNSQKQIPVDKLSRQYDLKPKEGQLLFRLANFFKPVSIIQIAPSDFFSTLYLSWYTENIPCFVVQNDKLLFALSEKMFPDIPGAQIDLRTGNIKACLPDILSIAGQSVLLYIDAIRELEIMECILEEVVKVIDRNSVLIVKGIRQNSAKKLFWKNICRHSETTVTLDLYSYGIALFNKKLHKRTYKVYFKN